MTQYPDVLSFTSLGGSVQDEQGHWVDSEPGEVVEMPCRYEPNNGSGYIVAVDGSRIDYAGIAYLKKAVLEIKEGTEVTLIIRRPDVVDQVFTEKVHRFFRGQLNARVWL